MSCTNAACPAPGEPGGNPCDRLGIAMSATCPEWLVPMAATLTQERFTDPAWADNPILRRLFEASGDFKGPTSEAQTFGTTGVLDTFVERLDFRTTVGHGDAPGDRATPRTWHIPPPSARRPLASAPGCRRPDRTRRA